MFGCCGVAMFIKCKNGTLIEKNAIIVANGQSVDDEIVVVVVVVLI